MLTPAENVKQESALSKKPPVLKTGGWVAVSIKFLPLG
jgi:hypothetical protein